MKHLFNKTREVPLAQFESLWNKGGFQTIGNQFSNCDKADYLVVIDKKAQELKAKKEEAMEAFHASIPTHTMGGVGRHPDNPEDEKRLHQMRDEIRAIDDVVTNITETFDAGWVSAGLHATGASKTTQSVAPLPEEWEECYLIYENYPMFEKVLVARNNLDGTVQLFRA